MVLIGDTHLPRFGRALPAPFRAQVEPLIPSIVGAIHEAFSIATAATFMIGIVTALAAAFVVLVLLPAGRMGEHAEPMEWPAPRMGEPDPALD